MNTFRSWFVFSLFSYMIVFFSYGVPEKPLSEEQKIKNALEKLTEESSIDRRRAAEALGRFKDTRAVEPLIKSLKDDDTDVRKSAAYALGGIRDKRAVPALIKLMLKDPEARPMAIRSLGLINDRRAIKPLKTMLVKKDPITVVEAALALGRFEGDDVTMALANSIDQSDDYGCQAIINVLAKRRSRLVTPRLIGLVQNQRTPAPCQLASIEALGWIADPKGKPTLEMILTDTSPLDLKVKALKAIGRMGSRSSYNLVVTFLDHSESQLRYAAIEAIVGLGDNRAVPYLKEKLKDEDTSVRDVAAFALGQLDPKSK